MKKFLAKLFGQANINVSAEDIGNELELTDEQVTKLDNYLEAQNQAAATLPNVQATVDAVTTALTEGGVAIQEGQTPAEAVTGVLEQLTAANNRISAAETALKDNNHAVGEDGNLAEAINALGAEDAGDTTTVESENDDIAGGEPVINMENKLNKKAKEVTGVEKFNEVPKEEPNN